MTDQTVKFERIPNPFFGPQGLGQFVHQSLTDLTRIGILSIQDKPSELVAVLNASFRALAFSIQAHTGDKVSATQALAWEMANVLRDYATMDVPHTLGRVALSPKCACPEPHADMDGLANRFMDLAVAGDNAGALEVYRVFTTGDLAADDQEKALASIGVFELGGPEYQTAHGRELLLNIAMHIVGELLRWNQEQHTAREDQQTEQDAANADMRQQNGDAERDYDPEAEEAAAMDPAPENV